MILSEAQRQAVETIDGLILLGNFLSVLLRHTSDC